MVRSISEIRREEITEAVLALLAEYGERSLSVQAIASKVGMAKASLYQHFNSLDEMIEAAIISIKTKFVALLHQARETVDDPKERLWVFFRNVSKLPTVPEAMFNLGRMDSKSGERWREIMLGIRDTLETELIKDIREAQEKDRFRADLTPEQILEVIFALYHFLKTEMMHRNVDWNTAGLAENTWSLFCKLVDKRSEF